MAEFTITVTVDDEDSLREIGTAGADWSESCSASTIGEMVREKLTDEINSLTADSVDLQVEVNESEWSDFLTEAKQLGQREWMVTLTYTVTTEATDADEAISNVRDDPYSFIDLWSLASDADFEAEEA